MVKKVVDEAMETRAARALSVTWDAIGMDTLQSYVDCGEAKDINKVVMSRAEVIDVVTSCGFATGYPKDFGNDKEAIEWLEAQSETVKKRVCKKAFPYARYGT
jgi:hypothetical protein